MMLITPHNSSDQISINFQVFYDELSPYGDWVFDPKYGYVWVPNVDFGFIPYSTNGYWAFTNAGWTWVSDYSWGWAPFHYGRWCYDTNFGWSWVPGNEWGPGWVSWRESEGYYGWAPIGPGISIAFAYSNEYSIPSNYWTFIRDRDFASTYLQSQYVKNSSNISIIKKSSVINNILIDNSSRVRYNSGPNRTEIQKQTGRLIELLELIEKKDPGQNIGEGELEIYRPQVTKSNATEIKPAPNKIAKKEPINSVSQRNLNTDSKKGNQEHNLQVKDEQVKDKKGAPKLKKIN